MTDKMKPYTHNEIFLVRKNKDGNYTVQGENGLRVIVGPDVLADKFTEWNPDESQKLRQMKTVCEIIDRFDPLYNDSEIQTWIQKIKAGKNVEDDMELWKEVNL